MKAPKLPRPAYKCLCKSVDYQHNLVQPRSHLSTTSLQHNEVEVNTIKSPYHPQAPVPLNRDSPGHPRHERRLVREQPYQCFPEARKVLAADREEKLEQITERRKRVAKWQAIPAEAQGGHTGKKARLVAMQKHLEDLKILADINDPVIKKRFEDGKGMVLTIALHPRLGGCIAQTDVRVCI